MANTPKEKNNEEKTFKNSGEATEASLYENKQLSNETAGDQTSEPKNEFVSSTKSILNNSIDQNSQPQDFDDYSSEAYYSCTGKRGPIDFEYTSANIFLGETFQIQLNDYKIKDQHDYDWISSNRDIAYVTSLGKVISRRRGKIKITVRNPNTGCYKVFPVIISGRPYLSPAYYSQLPIAINKRYKETLQFKLKILSVLELLDKLSDASGYETIKRVTKADDNTMLNWFRQCALWQITGMTKAFAYYAAAAGIRNIVDLSKTSNDKLYNVFVMLYKNGLMKEDESELYLPSKDEIKCFINIAVKLRGLCVNHYNIVLKNDDVEPNYLFDSFENSVSESALIKEGFDFLKNIKLSLPLPKTISGNIKIKTSRNSTKLEPLEGYCITLSGVTSGTSDHSTNLNENELCAYSDSNGGFIISMPDIYSLQEVLTFTIKSPVNQYNNLLSAENSGTVSFSKRKSDILDSVYRLIEGKNIPAHMILGGIEQLRELNQMRIELEEEILQFAREAYPDDSSKVAFDKYVKKIYGDECDYTEYNIVSDYKKIDKECKDICKTVVGIDYNTNDLAQSILNFLDGAFDSYIGELSTHKDAFQPSKPYDSVLPSVKLMGNDDAPVILPTDTAPSRVFNYSIMYRLVAPSIQKGYDQGKGKREKLDLPLDVLTLKNNMSYNQEQVPYASSLGIGYTLNMHQAWIPDGFALGSLLYSLVLAPGEEQRVIIREHSEQYDVTDDAYAKDTIKDTYLNYQQDNENAAFQNAVGRFSNAHSDSSYESTASSYGGTNIKLSLKKGIFGIGANSSATSTNKGSSYANSFQRDSYDEVSTTAQEFQSSIKTESERIAAAQRTSISIASSKEADAITSKIIANHNHSHVMTVQYWEVMRRYRMETAIESVDLVIYVPMKLINFMPTVKENSYDKDDINNYTIQNPTEFKKKLLTQRYRTLLENADVLMNYLPYKYRGGLELIRKYAALPEWTYVEYNQIETEYTITVAGGFLPFDNISAEIYFNNGYSPIYGQVVSHSYNNLDPSLNTRAHVIYGIELSRMGIYLSREQETAGDKYLYKKKKLWGIIPYSSKQTNNATIDVINEEEMPAGEFLLKFNLPEGVTKNDISFIIIRNNIEKWDYRLSQNLEYMEKGEKEAIKSYENQFVNYAKDNSYSDSDLKNLLHYESCLPECYRTPDIHFTASELYNCGNLSIRVTLDGDNNSTYYNIGRGGVRIDLGRRKPIITYREIAEMEETFRHIGSNTLYYSQAIWSSLDYNELVMLLDGYTLDLTDDNKKQDSNAVNTDEELNEIQEQMENIGNRKQIPLLNCINITNLLGFYGNCMLFPFTYPREIAEVIGKTAGDIQNELYRYHSNCFRSPLTYVSVPTSGMVGEAVLSETNVSEKIDITRFWNWKDSDIDHIDINQNSLGITSLLANAKTKDIDAPTIGVTATEHINGNNLASALIARQQPTFADVYTNTDMRDVMKNADSNASAGREQVVQTTSELAKSALDAAVQVGTAAATGGLSGIAGAGGSSSITGLLGSLAKSGLGDADLGSLVKGALGGNGSFDGIAKALTGMINGGESGLFSTNQLKKVAGSMDKESLLKIMNNFVSNSKTADSLADNFSKSISELLSSKKDFSTGDITGLAKQFCSDNDIDLDKFSSELGKLLGIIE